MSVPAFAGFFAFFLFSSVVACASAHAEYPQDCGEFGFTAEGISFKATCEVHMLMHPTKEISNTFIISGYPLRYGQKHLPVQRWIFEAKSTELTSVEDVFGVAWGEENIGILILPPCTKITMKILGPDIHTEGDIAFIVRKPHHVDAYYIANVLLPPIDRYRVLTNIERHFEGACAPPVPPRRPTN